MNKKMKIIELLNKIANGEELPKKIKVKNIEYNWTDKLGAGWYHENEDAGNEWVEDLINCTKIEDLNEIVEILEDNTEEIEGLEIGTITTDERLKINEIIKAVNKIRKDLDK